VLQQAPETPSRRIVSIQVCRGLAALLVVLAHLHGIEWTHFASQHLRLFGYGDIGVDIFFVISGIVIASVAAGKFGNPQNAVVFLYHRLARIFPIFWIYNSLSLLANHLAPLAGSTHQRSLNLLPSYLLIPTHLPMPLFQGWTLSFEVYFYLAITLLLLVPERIAPWLLAIWGVAVVALKLHIGLSPILMVQLLISPSVLEFLAGYALFHLYRRSRLHPAAGILLLAASVLLLVGIILYDNPGAIVNHPWKRPLLYGTFSVLLLSGALELERSQIIRYLPVFKSIGDWSYSIYLSHVLVLSLVAYLTERLLPYPVSLFVIAIIGLPAVLLTGYLSYTYIERPLLHLLYKSAPPSRNLAKQPT
jgi:exopolysaccharide production protein ExoZ